MDVFSDDVAVFVQKMDKTDLKGMIYTSFFFEEKRSINRAFRNDENYATFKRLARLFFSPNCISTSHP
jgi:hypothetical protein